MDKDFFDNAYQKTKSAFEIAYKKTGEVLSAEKIKFNISTLKTKREKLYAKLGKNYFDKLSDTAILGEEIKSICDEITELNSKIEELNNELEFTKSNRICPNCGFAIDESAIFCSKCGAKLEYNSEDSE